jgi:hypothetical protein
MEYLENHNADPKPFIWTKSAGQILEKVARAKQALESQHYPLQFGACSYRRTGVHFAGAAGGRSASSRKKALGSAQR